MAKRGILSPGTMGILCWRFGDTHMGSIRYEVRYNNQLRLIVRYWEEDSMEWCWIEIYLYIVFTQPHFGGRVPWFTCPECGRRAAKVYLTCPRLACRICLNLVYASQAESELDRVLRKLDKLGEKVVIEIGRPVSKPKRMRWHTFSQYYDEYNRLQDAKLQQFQRALALSIR
jgi:hypothetical protein